MESKERVSDDGDEEEDGAVLVAHLNLVDLAGSESFSTKFGHTQQQETKSINKSLSALKTVVVSLSKNEKHIPYRNSCLTKLLKSSLGGNAETDIIITLHAGEEYRKEIWFTWEKNMAFWVNGCGSVIQGTTSYLGNHEIQKKIVMEYTHSFLSIQIL